MFYRNKVCFSIYVLQEQSLFFYICFTGTKSVFLYMFYRNKVCFSIYVLQEQSLFFYICFTGTKSVFLYMFYRKLQYCNLLATMHSSIQLQPVYPILNLTFNGAHICTFKVIVRKTFKYKNQRVSTYWLTQR